MADIRLTGKIDDFDRTESPILPPWETMEGFFPGDCQAGVYGPVNLFSVSTGNYYDATLQPIAGLGNLTGQAMEVWATSGEAPDPREHQGIFLTSSPWLGMFGMSGYRVTIGLDVFGGAFTSLVRWDSGTPAGIGSYGQSIDTNEIALLRLTDPYVEVWVATSGGVWTRRIQVADTTYREGLFAGLTIASDDAAGPVWADFGGGLVNRSQIYRYVSN